VCAGALDAAGREALLEYMQRPPIAQERVTQGPDGLGSHRTQAPFSDGTVAIDLGPLSPRCRVAASVCRRCARTGELRGAGVHAVALLQLATLARGAAHAGRATVALHSAPLVRAPLLWSSEPRTAYRLAFLVPLGVAVGASVGGGLTRVTTSTGYNGAVSWSPDGAWLAYESSKDPNGESPTRIMKVRAQK
jgi:hypothetical protein